MEFRFSPDRTLVFTIPASFVLDRVMPTAAELGYGFMNGWLAEADVIGIALAKLKDDLPMTPAEEELAYLLSNQHDQVPELAAKLEYSDEPVERRARLWLYLALAWLLEHQASVEDPLEAIELLYADFDYPDEISSLVRFMPIGEGEAVGPEAIEARWREYVDRVGREYREREDLLGG